MHLTTLLLLPPIIFLLVFVAGVEGVGAGLHRPLFYRNKADANSTKTVESIQQNADEHPSPARSKLFATSSKSRANDSASDVSSSAAAHESLMSELAEAVSKAGSQGHLADRVSEPSGGYFLHGETPPVISRSVPIEIIRVEKTDEKMPNSHRNGSSSSSNPKTRIEMPRPLPHKNESWTSSSSEESQESVASGESVSKVLNGTRLHDAPISSDSSGVEVELKSALSSYSTSSDEEIFSNATQVRLIKVIASSSSSSEEDEAKEGTSDEPIESKVTPKQMVKDTAKGDVAAEKDKSKFQTIDAIKPVNQPKSNTPKPFSSVAPLSAKQGGGGAKEGYEVRDEVIDPYLNLRRYTFHKLEAADEKSNNIHGLSKDVKFPTSQREVFILRLSPRDRREAPPPAVGGETPVVDGQKQAEGGLSYNVHFGSANATKHKPVLSSSSRSSSRSSSPSRSSSVDKREAPPPQVDGQKQAEGGLAYNIRWENGTTKPKPVLSSSSSRSSSRSSLRDFGGDVKRKRSTPEDASANDTIVSIAVAAPMEPSSESNTPAVPHRSLISNLLKIGLFKNSSESAPLDDVSSEEKDEKEEVIQQIQVKAATSEIVVANAGARPLGDLMEALASGSRHKPKSSSSSSSSASSENKDSSSSSNSMEDKDKQVRHLDDSLEQVIVIADPPSHGRRRGPHRPPKHPANLQMTSIKTGPIFIKDSELHLSTGSSPSDGGDNKPPKKSLGEGDEDSTAHLQFPQERFLKAIAESYLRNRGREMARERSSSPHFPPPPHYPFFVPQLQQERRDFPPHPFGQSFGGFNHHQESFGHHQPGFGGFRHNEPGFGPMPRAQPPFGGFSHHPPPFGAFHHPQSRFDGPRSELAQEEWRMRSGPNHPAGPPPPPPPFFTRHMPALPPTSHIAEPSLTPIVPPATIRAVDDHRGPKGEEGLWMMSHGMTLTVHLNATSLGIISMLVVIIVLFKLYKLVHKRGGKCQAVKLKQIQGKEEGDCSKKPAVAFMDEVKI